MLQILDLQNQIEIPILFLKEREAFFYSYIWLVLKENRLVGSQFDVWYGYVPVKVRIQIKDWLLTVKGKVMFVSDRIQIWFYLVTSNLLNVVSVALHKSRNGTSVLFLVLSLNTIRMEWDLKLLRALDWMVIHFLILLFFKNKKQQIHIYW